MYINQIHFNLILQIQFDSIVKQIPFLTIHNVNKKNILLYKKKIVSAYLNILQLFRLWSDILNSWILSYTKERVRYDSWVGYTRRWFIYKLILILLKLKTCCYRSIFTWWYTWAHEARHTLGDITIQILKIPSHDFRSRK